jgi:hypothetical protein
MEVRKLEIIAKMGEGLTVDKAAEISPVTILGLYLVKTTYRYPRNSGQTQTAIWTESLSIFFACQNTALQNLNFFIPAIELLQELYADINPLPSNSKIISRPAQFLFKVFCG